MGFLKVLWISLIAYSTVQGLLLGIIFPTLKKGSASAKWLLSGISIVMALLLLEELFSNTIGYQNWPHLIFAFSPLWYLVAPLVYLYIRHIALQKHLGGWDLLHLIPMIWVALDMIQFYQAPGAYKLHYIELYRDGYTHPIHNFNYMLYVAQSMAYLYAGYRVISKASKYLEGNRYSVLKYFLWGMAFTVLMGIGSLIVANGSRALLDYASGIYVLWLSAFLLMLFVRSIRPQNTLCKINPYWDTNQSAQQSSNYQALLDYLLRERPYTNPSYTLEQLAQASGHSKYYLNQLIKSHTGSGFRDLINKLRVKEAKKQLSLAQNQQFTIQYIASSAGFASTATFYRIFKKIEGTTPKAFLKS